MVAGVAAGLMGRTTLLSIAGFGSGALIGLGFGSSATTIGRRGAGLGLEFEFELLELGKGDRLAEILDDEVGLVDRQVDDRGVQFTGHHVGDERRRGPFADDGAHVRVGVSKAGEERWGQPSSGRADDADAGVARHLVVTRGGVGGDVFDLVQHTPGALDHASAVFGQPALGTVDESDAEFFFEPGHVTRDVGLHRVKGSRCCGERSVIGNGDDRSELADIHL